MKYLTDIPISSIILKVHKLNRSFVFKNLGCTVTTNGGYDTEINKKKYCSIQELITINSNMMIKQKF